MDEEKSKVLGIKLDTDERKRFDEFVTDEGKNNKEFLSTLLNLYELNKGKAKNINLVGDIEVLAYGKDSCKKQPQDSIYHFIQAK